jgi:iron complex outermembrane receptor protein
VHIRGLDNVPTGSVLRYSANSLTLVMIDGREVYNHYTGGTFWESLPVAIGDLDRIEVVRGAAAAMYGPNAVTGVIQLFTKDPQKTRNQISGNAQAGSHDTYLGQADAGFAMGEHVAGRVSMSGQHRDREDSDYYEFAGKRWVDNPDDVISSITGAPLDNPDYRYPDANSALKNNAANIWLSGEWEKNRRVDLTVGKSYSQAQTIYDDISATPFTTGQNDSWYMNVDGKIDNWQVKLNYEDGTRDVRGADFFSFDFDTLNIELDGDYKVGGFTLQPMAEYTHKDYSGTAFSVGDNFASGDETMSIGAVGLRSEYQLGKWNLNAAVRADHYDYSGETEDSYTVGFTRDITDDAMMFASYSRAHQEPFMIYTFQRLNFPGTPLLVTGNENLDLTKVDDSELGMRWKLTTTTAMEVSLFYIKSDDYQIVENANNFPIIGGNPYVELQYQNIPLEATMQGVTVSLLHQVGDFNGNVFVTNQHTTLDNNSRLDQNLTIVEDDINEGHRNTPDWYGGFSLNYTGFQRWNCNLSSYYLGSSQQISQYNSQNFDGGKVSDNFMLNSKVSYQLTPQVQTYLTLQDILNNDKRQFAYGDKVGAMVLVGVDWKY